jgi:hypothetical protein
MYNTRFELGTSESTQMTGMPCATPLSFLLENLRRAAETDIPAGALPRPGETLASRVQGIRCRANELRLHAEHLGRIQKSSLRFLPVRQFDVVATNT